MAYCVLADLTKAIPERNLQQITDDSAGAVVDTAKVDQAIQDADDLIDSYLRGKHAVPLATVPNIIRRLSVDFTIYFLYRRRLEFEVSDAMHASYKEGIRFLEGVRDGKNLIGDAESAANTGGIFKTSKVTADRVYDSCRLDQF